jgi:hypothetical protein
MEHQTVSNEALEAQAEKAMSTEQRIQSQARDGVLRYLETDSSLTEDQRKQLNLFAERASKVALEKYEALKASDPLQVAEDIITKNELTWRQTDEYWIGGGYAATKDRLWMARYQISEASKRMRKEAADAGKDISDEEIGRRIKKVGSEIHFGLPKGNLDTNLVMLKAFGAVPEVVTDLKNYIGTLPDVTSDDRKFYGEHGYWQRPVQSPETQGTTIWGMPTKIDGVQMDGNRLYSYDTNGYGQIGFTLKLSEPAITRVLKTSAVLEGQPPK